MPEEFVEDILAEVTPTETPVEDLDKKPEQSLDQLEEGVKKEPVETKEESVDTTTPKTEVSIEDLATQIGWNPNYKGPDKVDAATFILKSREIQETMRDNNKELKNQLSSVQGSIEALKIHNERVYRADVKRMQGEINELKKQRKEAIELADVSKVDELDEQIDTLQKDILKPAPQEPPQKNEVYEDWVKDNQWYLNDSEMANYAEVVAQQYQGVPLNRIYNLIRKKVEEVFPEKFETNSTQANPSGVKKAIGPNGPVESPTKISGGNKSTFTEADLTPEQVSIMQQFVNTGVMTKEQYIADIAKMQEN